MKFYILALILSFPFICHAEEVDCKDKTTTYAINICAEKEMECFNAHLKKYLAKAKERYFSENSALEMMEKSQAAWLMYRKAHCNSIYELWSDGTMREVMFSDCMSKLTQERTYKIWEDYLTYMDSTPPLLPEPKLDCRKYDLPPGK